MDDGRDEECEQELITGYYAYQSSTLKCGRRLGDRSPIDGNQ